MSESFGAGLFSSSTFCSVANAFSDPGATLGVNSHVATGYACEKSHCPRRYLRAHRLTSYWVSVIIVLRADAAKKVAPSASKSRSNADAWLTGSDRNCQLNL